MWKRRSRPAREPYSYLHQGTVVRGDVVVEGRLRVHGTVHGDVRVGSLLEVAEEGSVLGQRIDVADVRILGRVRGDVHATGTVQIWRGGRLDGDVHAATLDIEQGAHFAGRSHVLGSDAQARSQDDPEDVRPPSSAGSDADAAEQELPAAAAAEDGREGTGGVVTGNRAASGSPRRGGEARGADDRAGHGERSPGGAADGRSGPA